MRCFSFFRVSASRKCKQTKPLGELWVISLPLLHIRLPKKAKIDFLYRMAVAEPRRGALGLCYAVLATVLLLPLRSAASQEGLTSSAVARPGVVVDGTTMRTVPWANGVTRGTGSFGGCVFDGTHIWMPPSLFRTTLVRLHPQTGEMKEYSNFPPNIGMGNLIFGFGGILFDGDRLWFIPLTMTTGIVRMDRSSGVMTLLQTFPPGLRWAIHEFSDGSWTLLFQTGTIDDNKRLWLCPSLANMLVSVDTATGTMKGYSNWPDNYISSTYPNRERFNGIVFDGTYIWLLPRYANMIVRFDRVSETMTPFLVGIYNGAYLGGVFDGSSIWAAPLASRPILRIDTKIFSSTQLPLPAAVVTMCSNPDFPYIFAGIVFDGTYLWFLPLGANVLLRVGKATGIMTMFSRFPAGTTLDNSFGAGVFDGRCIYLIPNSPTNNIVRVGSHCIFTDTFSIRLSSEVSATLSMMLTPTPGTLWTSPSLSLSAATSESVTLEKTLSFPSTTASSSLELMSATITLSSSHSWSKVLSVSGATVTATRGLTLSIDDSISFSMSPTRQTNATSPTASLTATATSRGYSLSPTVTNSIDLPVTEEYPMALVVAQGLAAFASFAAAASSAQPSSISNLVLVLSTMRCSLSTVVDTTEQLKLSARALSPYLGRDFGLLQISAICLAIPCAIFVIHLAVTAVLWKVSPPDGNRYSLLSHLLRTNSAWFPSVPLQALIFFLPPILFSASAIFAATLTSHNTHNSEYESQQQWAAVIVALLGISLGGRELLRLLVVLPTVQPLQYATDGLIEELLQHHFPAAVVRVMSKCFPEIFWSPNGVACTCATLFRRFRAKQFIWFDLFDVSVLLVLATSLSVVSHLASSYCRIANALLAAIFLLTASFLLWQRPLRIKLFNFSSAGQFVVLGVISALKASTADVHVSDTLVAIVAAAILADVIVFIAIVRLEAIVYEEYVSVVDKSEAELSAIEVPLQHHGASADATSRICAVNESNDVLMGRLSEDEVEVCLPSERALDDAAAAEEYSVDGWLEKTAKAEVFGNEDELDPYLRFSSY